MPRRCASPSAARTAQAISTARAGAIGERAAAHPREDDRGARRVIGAQRDDVRMAELREGARLALEAEEGVAAALVIEAREELERDALAGDAIDRLEHARVRRDGDLAHGLVAAEEERAALVGGGRGRVLGLDVGDAVAIHLLAERARGFLQADLDEAAPEQRERLHALGRPRLELLQGLHGGLGAAVTREEPAELEAASGVAGAHAERGLEGARAVGRAPSALEAARGAARVADRSEGLARF